MAPSPEYQSHGIASCKVSFGLIDEECNSTICLCCWLQRAGSRIRTRHAVEPTDGACREGLAVVPDLVNPAGEVCAPAISVHPYPEALLRGRIGVNSARLYVRRMRRRTIASLLIVALATGAGAGYAFGLTTQTSFSGRCTPWGNLRGFTPAGINVTVSYQGNWRLTIAEFASNQTRASTLDSACYYEGSGTMSFYVSIANYQGWNTIIALAHKWGTSGTLTITVAVGPSRSTNSTASPYGDATTSLSFLW